MASFEVWTLISSHIILKTKETSIFFYGTERSIVIFNWILFKKRLAQGIKSIWEQYTITGGGKKKILWLLVIKRSNKGILLGSILQ